MLEPVLVKVTFSISLFVALSFAYRLRSREPVDSQSSRAKEVRSFQRTYLLVYLPAMMADWLQGPYIYALYEAYGYTQSDNALLFTVGFGSSAILGTFIGSLADKMGRRNFAGLYCLLYGTSCLTKHVNDFAWLAVGRVTGGAATSLLFSVFDSWMVSEHNARRFEPELLGGTFSLAVFTNSLMAIAAGVLGEAAADSLELTRLSSRVHYGGYCSPFDVAIGFLMLAAVLMGLLWKENYGTSSAEGAGSQSVASGFCTALRAIREQPRVLECGLVCALFEASMFIFIFMWTPGLTEEGEPKPLYGMVFASFMVMTMLGSQIFTMVASRFPIEKICMGVLFVSACSNLVPLLTEDVRLRYASFLLFEGCVGVYFPMSGTLKAEIVPEESRSAIYNLYRIPLNFIVVSALTVKIDVQLAFGTTTCLLLVAMIFPSRLAGSSAAGAKTEIRATELVADAAILEAGKANVPQESRSPEEELVTLVGARGTEQRPSPEEELTTLVGRPAS